ncbi:3-dehydroquinate synthase [Marinilactibacillus piezotolerans]|uniref:3-dehydroquinate synthase n=1 Tax=Marinilactibacillus piezotolerans TaxID=258723 RepID=A0A1I3XGS6_9LACT|nr:3-dehydroquinate synthase [Marinilactibacillus piezotolerans]SFK18549.1 3-dehydroquinate synthase [Marinilactibacillus piezotolerans]
MPEITVAIPANETSYALKIEKKLLNKVGKEIAQIFNGSKIMVVTDETVHGYYGETVLNQLKTAGYDVQCIVLPPGEQTKAFSSMPNIYSQLIEFGLTRSDLIIALGGGVVGDITGFAAATYLRGISFVQIPTTLLAQVDSSVGGKVGVDLPEGKNLVGAFYHPKLVLIDPLVLETLTDLSFADGMAEVIKYGCIKDEPFFNLLMDLSSREEVMEQIEYIIEKCCTIKKEVVQADEKDTSERMLLNFGHTLGHAIEAYYNYETYSHGQGVAIGMVELSKIAEEKSLTKSGTTEKIISILEKNHLPTKLAEPRDYAKILTYIKKDKKNFEGSLNVILLNEIGQAQKLKTNRQFFDALKTGGTTN